MATVKDDTVRVELSQDLVIRLLARGELCAADFRCLDCRSQHCLWRLALESCRMASNRQSSDSNRIVQRDELENRWKGDHRARMKKALDKYIGV